MNPLTYQPHSNFQQGAAMFTASSVQMRLELLVCDRSVSVNVITHTFVGLKCLTETKIQILCDHVDHTCFHIVEMGCQTVQLLSPHIGSALCIGLQQLQSTVSTARRPTPYIKQGRQCTIQSEAYVFVSPQMQVG